MAATSRRNHRAPNATTQRGEERLMELDAIAGPTHASSRTVVRVAPYP
jgi:hypothetical protein